MVRGRRLTMPTQSPATNVTKPSVSVPANNPMAGMEAMTDAQKHVHDILNDLTTVMMITFDDAPASDARGKAGARSGLHARPMSVARLDPDGSLWFVTAIDSPKVGEAESPPVGHVTGQTTTRYISLSGTFSVTRERDALERVWSKANDIWFPEGVNDPRVCLLGFHPTEAEFWDMSGAKGLSFVFEAAKALLTGQAIEQQDDPERHAKVRMS